MTSVRLIWITPEAEKIILYCARVSSPHQDSGDTGLLRYCFREGHWSIYDQANLCVEVITSRAISAQILRHKSMYFQEFSQRYAKSTNIISYNPRRQDDKNRQNSIDDLSEETKTWWAVKQKDLAKHSSDLYNEALKRGVAKECARMILPMSAETKLYVNGTVRSWIHYLQSRTHCSTQLEHREVALMIEKIFAENLPIIYKAFKEYK